MKKEIKRSDFKYNFLKKIIMRIDYTGILDLELEKTIILLKEMLQDSGFVNLKEEYINEVDFDLKDPEKIETQLVIPISELKKNKAFIFTTENNNMSLQVTRFFTFIDINLDGYVKFEELAKTFSKVIEIIKENNKFIRVLRLGLRKINNCLLLDISKLNEYFEERYFTNILPSIYEDDFTVNLLKSHTIDSFYIKDKEVNLIRFLSQGWLSRNKEEKEAYQVVLDIDVYNRDQEPLKEIVGQSESVYKELIDMNNMLFKLYVEMLKDEFIIKLQTTGVDEEIIIGVEIND